MQWKQLKCYFHLIFLKFYGIIFIEIMKKRYFKLTPYDVLTEKDRDLIEYYVQEFGPTDASNMSWYNWEGVEVILKEWNTSKNISLFKMFGENELILRRPYTYKYNTEGLTREISVAMEDKAFKDVASWWNWSIKHKGGVNFEVLSADNNPWGYSKFFHIENAFDAKALAENAYHGEEYKVKFEDGSIFKVSSGMKPMKILHKFIEKYGKPEDEEMFDRFRIWHSQLLNQKAVDGELCLSIHPLDYMTMSDNANGWSSCMRWTDKYHHDSDPGDYRAGTIDCMNSPYIVIAYLHNPKHPFTIGKEWEWNSKRWRELFIVNEGSITEIKGYPYQDENLTNTCLMWIKEIAEKNLGWTYEDEEVNAKDSISLEDGRILLLDYIKSPYMYKDIGSLNKHAARINHKILLEKFQEPAYYTLTKGTPTTFFIRIPYGGIPTCMCCGGERIEDEGDRSVMCGRCENKCTCGNCGSTIYSDDETYWVEECDSPLCYDCWCEATNMDTITEEYHLSENMTEIWLLCGYDVNKNPIWYRDQTIWVYDPVYNWQYQKLFTSAPKYQDEKGRYADRHYITINMIRHGEYDNVMDLFNNPDDEDLYPYNLYYLPDWSRAYPDDDDEETA